MTIDYSLIARGEVIIVSHQIGSGNYHSIAESMLPNIPLNVNTKITYTSESFMYHVVVEDGLIYLCVSEPAFGRLVPYAFLKEIQKRFTSGSLPIRAATCGENGLQRDFEQVLAAQMEYFSTSEEVNKVTKLQSQVDSVKEIMQENIEKVLQRGDKLEELESKASDLESNSSTFRSQTRKVVRKMWWKNTRMTIILAMVAVGLVAILTVIILYATGVLPPDSGY
ncbi:PREDICTED: vesicle-associated membrane protein 7-like [Priapulus caudatus]|uniref:Vesicle-associated membrane protein 7 n=1 Tax=Priapulus caudatus TaxID=37621 RepID=A0ABM1EEA8_PRICU|nr:PREDICTED: vesicle-associated membrane protein 7-like [Priapulus caudatus]XP_014670536.1 PREDICTED: vesicle-associated membrane protein 7-like [Priapulus caudatus]XP_014670544.1 PREDICTED: vesicle-associated membrane protein 7-like [Priapulus caudatus]